MNRGFIIVAQNSDKVNYIKCATILCKNIKMLMPNESVTLLTDSLKFNNDYDIFDNVIFFPYGDRCKNDEWKLANDWQVYEASPYEFTIKIEADMYIPRNISYWWDILRNHDLILCTKIRNFKNEISNSRFYRKIIDDNKLPDIYNAITYFKKSDISSNFFYLVRDIFENWNEHKKLLKCIDSEIATTDIVYAIAAHIIGIEKCTLPDFNEFSFIHMKQMINNTHSENWTDELVYEILPNVLRINTIPQLYPFHYHVKDFSNILGEELYE